MTDKITIKFPIYLEDFSDYHDFDDIIETFQRIGIKKVKYHELPYDDINYGSYRAIFYLTKNDAFKKLVKKYTYEEKQ